MTSSGFSAQPVQYEGPAPKGSSTGRSSESKNICHDSAASVDLQRVQALTGAASTRVLPEVGIWIPTLGLEPPFLA